MTDDHSEQFVPDGDGAPTDDAEHPAPEAAEVEAPEVPRTGNADVDGVLDSLDALADAPVAEHVAVFEAAHDRLRAALSGAGDPPPPPRG